MRGSSPRNWGSGAVAALSVAAGYAAAELVVRLLRSQLEPLTVYLARTVEAMLGWTGIAVARSAAVLQDSDGFAYEIDVRCLSLAPILILAALLAADRKTRFSAVPDRAAGAAKPWLRRFAAGCGVLLLLNLMRLVSLFWIGMQSPEYFGIAHDVLWPLAVLGALLALWRLPAPVRRRRAGLSAPPVFVPPIR